MPRRGFQRTGLGSANAVLDPVAMTSWKENGIWTEATQQWNEKRPTRLKALRRL